MSTGDSKQEEAFARVALEKASQDWQDFKREHSVFTGKFNPSKEESLWQVLTSARQAHDLAYSKAYG
jgi:hypothetical protein